MKFFILTVALFAVASAGKQKRDIGLDLGSGYNYPAPVVKSEYLPPTNQYLAPAPQVNSQYLPPQVNSAPQLPSTSYGVPFKSAPVYRAPAPVYRAPTPVYSAPAPVYSAPAPVYRAPAPVYGAPVVHQAPAQQYYVQAPAQQHYVQAPVQQHYVPAPVQQQYVQAPVQQQQYVQAPAPVYGTPSFNNAPQQERLVFEAPIQSIEVSQSHSVESAPAPVQVSQDTVAVEAVNFRAPSYSQQQSGSNGGYVY